MRWPARTPLPDELRKPRSLNLAENVLQDLRFGFRMLLRNPGFSILAVLCLTVGIGANAAVFSLIEGVLFRPFPAVAHQDRMVAIAGTQPRGDKGSVGFGSTDVSWPDFLDFRRSCTLMDWFIVDRITGSTISIGERAEHVAGSVVSSIYVDSRAYQQLQARGFQ